MLSKSGKFLRTKGLSLEARCADLQKSIQVAGPTTGRGGLSRKHRGWERVRRIKGSREKRCCLSSRQASTNSRKWGAPRGEKYHRDSTTSPPKCNTQGVVGGQYFGGETEELSMKGGKPSVWISGAFPKWASMGPRDLTRRYLVR